MKNRNGNSLMHKLNSFVEDAEEGTSAAIENANLAFSLLQKIVNELPQKAKEAGISLTNRTCITLSTIAEDVFYNGNFSKFVAPFPIVTFVNRGDKYGYSAGYDMNQDDDIVFYFARGWQNYQFVYSWEKREWLPVEPLEDDLEIFGSMRKEIEKESSIGALFLFAYSRLNRKKCESKAEFIKMCENEVIKYQPLAALLDSFPSKLRCTVVDDKIAVEFYREGIEGGYAVGYKDGTYVLYQHFCVSTDERETTYDHEVGRTSNREIINTFIARTIEKSNTYRPDAIEQTNIAVPLSFKRFVVIEGMRGLADFNPEKLENLSSSEMGAARFAKDFFNNFLDMVDQDNDPEIYNSSAIIDLSSLPEIVGTETNQSGKKADIIDFCHTNKRLEGKRR